jgi:hypothetical protein
VLCTHDITTSATCTTAQFCTVCNFVLAPAAGHDWSGDWIDSGDGENFTKTCINCPAEQKKTETSGGGILITTPLVPETCDNFAPGSVSAELTLGEGSKIKLADGTYEDNPDPNLITLTVEKVTEPTSNVNSFLGAILNFLLNKPQTQ